MARVAVPFGLNAPLEPARYFVSRAVGDSLERPVGDGIEIGVGELFGDALSRLAADLVVAVEDLGHLLTGDGLGGLERAVLIAVDDLVRAGPQNGVGVPAAVRAVGELLADLARRPWESPPCGTGPSQASRASERRSGRRWSRSDPSCNSSR